MVCEAPCHYHTVYIKNLSDRLNPSEGTAERLTLAEMQFNCVFLPLRTVPGCVKGDTIFLIQ